jgi:hypothetical protein
MALMNKRHFILLECFFLETLLCALNPLKTQNKPLENLQEINSFSSEKLQSISKSKKEN